ncbi:MAG: HTH domain-containing protein [Verrucomicrobia bacterium]|nr:HTH domain-containing protein [Verrucomicrobiota bacterium]
MSFIRRLLDNGEPFNASRLALLFEVSSKTINRDIEFMRDRLGYEIEYDHSINTFVGSAPKRRIL